MSGTAPLSRHVLPRGRGAEIPNEERRARRRAGDFTHLAPILPESGPFPSPVADYNKDLPRIPSTSTGLWGTEVATILTEQMGSPVTLSVADFTCLPKPPHHMYEGVPITEAQKIAAQYRQRHQSTLAVPPTSETLDKGVLNVSADDPVESSHSFPSSVVTLD
jgi:hypothetical protein